MTDRQTEIAEATLRQLKSAYEGAVAKGSDVDADKLARLKEQVEAQEALLSSSKAGVNLPAEDKKEAENLQAFLGGAARAGSETAPEIFFARRERMFGADQTTSNVPSQQMVTDPRVDWFDRDLTLLQTMIPRTSDTLDVKLTKEASVQDAVKAKNEGQAFETSSATSEFVETTLRKMGTAQTFTLPETQEANRDYANSYVRERIEFLVRKKEEEYLWKGDGSTASNGTQPLGITRISTAGATYGNELAASATVAKVTTSDLSATEKVDAQYFNLFNEIVKQASLMSKSDSTGCGMRPTHLVMGVDDYARIKTVRDNDGRYIFDVVSQLPTTNPTFNIMGLPVVVSEFADANKFWLICQPLAERWMFRGGGIASMTGLNADDLIKSKMTTVMYTFGQTHRRRDNCVKLINFAV